MKPVIPVVVKIASTYNGPNGRSLGRCEVDQVIGLAAGGYLNSLISSGHVVPQVGAVIPPIETPADIDGDAFRSDQDPPNKEGGGAPAVPPAPVIQEIVAPLTLTAVQPPAIPDAPPVFAPDPEVKAALMSLAGVGEATADKLIAGGVVSLPDFANRKPNDIADMIGGNVSLTKIAGWINEASTKLAGA